MSGQPLEPQSPRCDANVEVLKAQLEGKFKLVDSRFETAETKLEEIMAMLLSVKRTLCSDADPRTPSLATRLVLVEKWISSQKRWNMIVGTALLAAAINYILELCRP